MALEALSTRRKDIWMGGNYIVEWYQAGDGTMIPGVFCQDDDADEVKVCAVDGNYPLGQVGCLPTLDIDTAIAIGTSIMIYLNHSAAKTIAPHDATVEALAKGQPLMRSGNIAGYTQAFAYTDAAEATDSLVNKTGMVLRTYAAAADKWIEILL
jgi:hypothetical protein